MTKDQILSLSMKSDRAFLKLNYSDSKEIILFHSQYTKELRIPWGFGENFIDEHPALDYKNNILFHNFQMSLKHICKFNEIKLINPS